MKKITTNTPLEVKIKPWHTPISKGDIHIVSLKWGLPSFSVENYISNQRFNIPDIIYGNENVLTAYILHEDSSTIYELNVHRLTGFRLLDESGLLELWSNPSYSKTKYGNTFLVKDHGWHKESPLIFFHGSPKDGEYSHLIATENECLEIVCYKPPIINKYIEIDPTYCESDSDFDPIDWLKNK